ncbi:porin [Roseitranquillus sediminis]|uniref:porin n=1 Tax=Roseitranquillus sediminis TaxID=2809051 RepID=UPI001D0CA30D|nr:porin [Roseitranquillus sediminis]MBM9596272.1 porin [Roseitranquillus sediminis]
MKTVLFATTALVASTTFALADVTLTGAAEMGVAGGDLGLDADGDDSALVFHTDIDVTFTLVGETDTGLSFGASVDLDEEIGDNNAVDGGGESGATRDDDDDGGATIFISGAFGTLTMGDTDGAFDWAMTEAIIGSSLRDDHEHAGYSGNAGLDNTYDNQVARYEYAFTDFSVAISGEIDDEGEGEPVLGLGGRYATSFAGVDVAFGAGVQTVNGLDDVAGDALDDDVDNLTIWGLSADMTFAGGFQVIANYSDLDDAGSHYGIAVGYTMDALTVAANYGRFHDVPFDTGEDDAAGDPIIDEDDASGWGLVANYDLGGGAELQAGYGHGEDVDGDNVSTYSFGVAMAF